MNDHSFCRVLLKELMPYVRGVATKDEIKASWAWKSSSTRSQGEFHGPSGFYWQGSACCLYAAKSEGWSRYLKQKGIDINE